MAKPKPKRQPSQQPSPKLARLSGRVVLFSIAGCVLAVLVSIPFLTPLLITAPLVPFLLRETKADRLSDMPSRWALTVFLTLAACSAFASDRTLHAVPMAAGAMESFTQWVSGTGGAPPGGWGTLIVGYVAVVGLAAVTGGVAGALLLSSAISSAAVITAYLFANGNNVFQVALIAVSPWLLASFRSVLFLIAPAAAFSRAAILEKDPSRFDWTAYRRDLLSAALLFALALLLRATTADLYGALVRRWTVIG